MADVLLAQGAEGRLYISELLGESVVIKERFRKQYRHPVLDAKLTEKRFFQEARNMLKARKHGVLVPAILFLDPFTHKIYMQHIQHSLSVKSFLQQCPVLPPALMQDLANKVARGIAKMHDIKLIHGDLTTSNILIQPEAQLPREMQGGNQTTADEIVQVGSVGKVYIIDFGLSFQSGLPEDKAVDLYVLERAITSMHPNSIAVFDSIISAYQTYTAQGHATIQKLNQVRMRGRKRLAFG